MPRGAHGFNLGPVPCFVTLGDDQIDIIKIAQQTIQIAGVIISDHGNFSGRVKNNGIGACDFMPGTVLARPIDVEVMVRVFNGADFVSAFFEFGNQLFNKCGFAGISFSISVVLPD